MLARLVPLTVLVADEQLTPLLVLPTDEAIDDDEVGEVSSKELLVLLDELDRRASDMLASVVRPQLGSTSSARLLIWVVMLSRLMAPVVMGFWWAWMTACGGACTGSQLFGLALVLLPALLFPVLELIWW